MFFLLSAFPLLPLGAWALPEEGQNGADRGCIPSPALLIQGCTAVPSQHTPNHSPHFLLIQWEKLFSEFPQLSSSSLQKASTKGRFLPTFLPALWAPLSLASSFGTLHYALSSSPPLHTHSLAPFPLPVQHLMHLLRPTAKPCCPTRCPAPPLFPSNFASSLFSL